LYYTGLIAQVEGDKHPSKTVLNVSKLHQMQSKSLWFTCN